MLQTIKKINQSIIFSNLSLLLILFSAILVGLETSQEFTKNYHHLFSFLDSTILILFSIEIIIKFLGTAPNFLNYFKDRWNLFDFSILAASLILMGTPYLNVLRLLRVLRALRMIRAIPKLRIIVEGLAHGLSSMTYIGLLLGLMFYIYSVLGVFLFRSASLEHFGTLGTAAFTLFQVITLEGWVEILNVIEASAPILSKIYFISFIVMGTMIFLNLFIGAIVSGMADAEKHSAEVKELDLHERLHEINKEIEQIKTLLLNK